MDTITKLQLRTQNILMQKRMFGFTNKREATAVVRAVKCFLKRHKK